jgi:hypothetical protein
MLFSAYPRRTRTFGRSAASRSWMTKFKAYCSRVSMAGTFLPVTSRLRTELGDEALAGCWSRRLLTTLNAQGRKALSLTLAYRLSGFSANFNFACRARSFLFVMYPEATQNRSRTDCPPRHPASNWANSFSARCRFSGSGSRWMMRRIASLAPRSPASAISNAMASRRS